MLKPDFDFWNLKPNPVEKTDVTFYKTFLVTNSTGAKQAKKHMTNRVNFMGRKREEWPISPFPEPEKELLIIFFNNLKYTLYEMLPLLHTKIGEVNFFMDNLPIIQNLLKHPLPQPLKGWKPFNGRPLQLFLTILFPTLKNITLCWQRLTNTRRSPTSPNSSMLNFYACCSRTLLDHPQPMLQPLSPTKTPQSKDSKPPFIITLESSDWTDELKMLEKVWMKWWVDEIDGHGVM